MHARLRPFLVCRRRPAAAAAQAVPPGAVLRVQGAGSAAVNGYYGGTSPHMTQSRGRSRVLMRVTLYCCFTIVFFVFITSKFVFIAFFILAFVFLCFFLFFGMSSDSFGPLTLPMSARCTCARPTTPACSDRHEQ